MKGRIKQGAGVSQDHRFFKWPLQNVEPDMVFDMEWKETFWLCKADGFGCIRSLGDDGDYGNGCLFLHSFDDVLLEDPTSGPAPPGPYLGRTPCSLDKLVPRFVPPAGGWKGETYYAVDVAFSSNNLIHRRVFFSGYLRADGQPGAYNAFFNSAHSAYSEAYFLRVVRELNVEEA